jgi:hypothetical protein
MAALVMLIHMGIGGQVEDGINAGAGKGQSAGVVQVALKAQAVARIGPGLRLLPRVGMHAAALFQQALDQAAADEAAGASNKDGSEGCVHNGSGDDQCFLIRITLARFSNAHRTSQGQRRIPVPWRTQSHPPWPICIADAQQRCA